MHRRGFLVSAGSTAGLAMLQPTGLFEHFLGSNFPEVRVKKNNRNFQSEVIENAINRFRDGVKDKELGWLFNNCFPNTLDTTVAFGTTDGVPKTYIITGDIDAMWLRDSSAQVWSYLEFANEDVKLKQLIAGVINTQTEYILKDPYANAFYDDKKKQGYWKDDNTEMKPGIHERKWEIDSLCYPIRLAYKFWKKTGDTSCFDSHWVSAIKSTVAVFKDQQRKENRGNYTFQRKTERASDTQPMGGYGYPVKPVGLVASAFRPSDDATVFPFLIPSNFFAVVSLNQASEMLEGVKDPSGLASECRALAKEISDALNKHAIINHPKYGDIYAFEIDGYGNHLLIDDANVPSLLSLPYLDAVKTDDTIYQNTRRFILSLDNPFFFKGEAAEGVGGPHVGMDMIWPMAITMRGLTSISKSEISECIQILKNTHANTGFMHESFHKDNPEKYTRDWFAWANTLFGEFLWKTYQEHPELLG